MARKYALVSNGPLSGKSTLAKHLEKEYGFIRADHSLTLVQAMVDDWNSTAEDEMLSGTITVEEVYRDKEFWRPLLQGFGYRVGFNDTAKTEHWIRQTLTRSGCSITQARCPGAKPSVCPDKSVVFDSFRGEVQGQALRDLGFRLVQINIKDVTRCERARMLGKTCGEVLASMDAAPELERGIERPDITLVGELAVDVLGRTLMHRPEDMTDLQIFGNR